MSTPKMSTPNTSTPIITYSMQGFIERGGRPGISPPPPPEFWQNYIISPTYVPLYTLCFQQYDTVCSCQKPRQNASKNDYFSKNSWGGMPPDPPSRTMLHTPPLPPPQHKFLYETLICQKYQFCKMPTPRMSLVLNISIAIRVCLYVV